MRTILTASKDTTLYQAYVNNNAGLDEILEIGKVINLSEPTSSTAYETGSARSLLYFELPTTASVPATASYFLNLKLANANNVKRNQEILVYQVSRSWDEGSGFFYQEIENPFFKKDFFCENITEIHFYHNLIIIKKMSNKELSNILVNNFKPIKGNNLITLRKIVKFIKYFIYYVRSIFYKFLDLLKVF